MSEAFYVYVHKSKSRANEIIEQTIFFSGSETNELCVTHHTWSLQDLHIECNVKQHYIFVLASATVHI
jgi:hypothetical protein